MQNYELLFILPGTLAENETQPIADKVKAAVERNHGEGIEVVAMDKKRLAYPIKHIRYGYFYLVFFKAENKDTQQIRADLRLMTELLRATVQKHDPEKSLRQIEFGQVYPNMEMQAPVVESKPVESVVETVVEEPVKEGEAPEVVSEVVPMAEQVPPVEQAVVAEEKPEVVSAPAFKKAGKKKIDLDEIDKKLDEILDIDLGSV